MDTIACRQLIEHYRNTGHRSPEVAAIASVAIPFLETIGSGGIFYVPVREVSTQTPAMLTACRVSEVSEFSDAHQILQIAAGLKNLLDTYTKLYAQKVGCGLIRANQDVYEMSEMTSPVSKPGRPLDPPAKR